MQCEKCEGKGWIPHPVFHEAKTVIKEWCEVCKGTGKVKYEGDRSGIEWERE